MVFVIGLLLFAGSLFVLFKIRDRKLLKTVTQLNRGTKTERELVLKLLKSDIPAQTIFHDLFLKKNSGNYSQIDLAVATKVGILVFEVKEYSGWIFGTADKPDWTQILNYGKSKYRFYNPIMQNSTHIKDLKKSLKQEEGVPFYSIVVFYGDCELKDIRFVPDGTFIVKSGRVLEVVQMILNSNKPASYSNKLEIVKVLKEAVKNGGNSEIQRQHVETINNMLGRNRIFN